MDDEEDHQEIGEDNDEIDIEELEQQGENDDIIGIEDDEKQQHKEENKDIIGIDNEEEKSQQKENNNDIIGIDNEEEKSQHKEDNNNLIGIEEEEKQQHNEENKNYISIEDDEEKQTHNEENKNNKKMEDDEEKQTHNEENKNNKKMEDDEDKQKHSEENKNNKKMEDEKQSEEIPEEISIEPDENEAKNSIKNKTNSNLSSFKDLASNLQKTFEKKDRIKSPKSNKKQNQNPKNIQKKVPYIVSEKQTEPYKKIKITINACSFLDEYLMPIWCPKNVYIKFRVEGKWRIDKKYEFTDSRGLRSNNSKGYNYGALIGRIGKKNDNFDEKEKEKNKKKAVSSLLKENNFLVANEVTFLVKEEGPLFLRANLPKKLKIEPEGKLEVSIYDVDYMDISEINEKIGWIENGTIIVGNNDKKKSEQSPNKIKGNKKELNEKEIEKSLRKNINNLRMNPNMYYEKYISFNANYLWTKEYLEKIENEPRDPLEEDLKSYRFLVDYTKSSTQQQLKKKLNKNNISQYLEKINEDLSYYIKDLVGLSKIIKVRCKITKKDNPIDIIVQYLLDKQYRRHIFNQYSKGLTIKIVKNFFNDSTLVIMVIILDRDNVLLEEPASI